jgi:hypothetical protein
MSRTGKSQNFENGLISHEYLLISYKNFLYTISPPEPWPGFLEGFMSKNDVLAIDSLRTQAVRNSGHCPYPGGLPAKRLKNRHCHLNKVKKGNGTPDMWMYGKFNIIGQYYWVSCPF